MKNFAETLKKNEEEYYIPIYWKELNKKEKITIYIQTIDDIQNKTEEGNEVIEITGIAKSETINIITPHKAKIYVFPCDFTKQITKALANARIKVKELYEPFTLEMERINEKVMHITIMKGYKDTTYLEEL
jgi:hypothetical protein